jgi:hypothetical protein
MLICLNSDINKLNVLKTLLFLKNPRGGWRGRGCAVGAMVNVYRIPADRVCIYQYSVSPAIEERTKSIYPSVIVVQDTY